MSIHIDVVSAEGQLYGGEANTVFVEAVDGDLAVMARHAPLLTKIRPGPVRIRQDNPGDEEQIFVSGGLLEVQPHLVTVLADTAERAEDIDEAQAEQAKERADAAISESSEQTDIDQARADLAEASARLRMVQQIRKGR